MRTVAQSAPASWHRRTGVWLALVFLLGSFAPVDSASAQEADNRAGLVIQFGDGSLRTVCVDLGPDGQATGEEMLRASGLATLIDYGSGFGGGTVCKIGSEGCGFPAQPCFCQCTMKPGDPCIYWSYFHLRDGQWRYANHGVSSYVVGPGDVEGWAGGLGAVGAGVQLPLITYEQICGAPSAATQLPATPALLLPTATPALPATLTATASSPTATPSPTTMPRPSGKPSSTPSRSSANTPVAATFTPSARPNAVATHTPLPSPMSSVGLSIDPTTPAVQTSTPQSVALQADEGERMAPGSDSGTLALHSVQEAPSIASPPQAAQNASGKASYVFFGVLLLFLVAGLIYRRVR